LVEHNLAKVGVAGSSPVFRSKNPNYVVWIFFWLFFEPDTLVAEQVDAQDLKSCSPKGEYGFDSRLGYLLSIRCMYITSLEFAFIETIIFNS
jgi:hypothetical protein